MLAAIWAEVLNLDQIGIHDNFFELGGNSVLAFMVIARIAKIFGDRLLPTALFHAPTIAKLASLLQQKE